jgi:hypothetical protein
MIIGIDTLCGQMDGFLFVSQHCFQGSEAFIRKYFDELMQISQHKNANCYETVAKPTST